MLGFFIIRRLIELYKVSSATRDRSLKIFSYPNRGKPVRGFSVDIHASYDLENENEERKKAVYVSNQFIHARISFVVRDESRNWSNVLVVSDYDRNVCLWRIPIPEICRLFLSAARDYPHEMKMVFNEKRGDYDVWTN